MQLISKPRTTWNIHNTEERIHGNSYDTQNVHLVTYVVGIVEVLWQSSRQPTAAVRQLQCTK